MHSISLWSSVTMFLFIYIKKYILLTRFYLSGLELLVVCFLTPFFWAAFMYTLVFFHYIYIHKESLASTSYCLHTQRIWILGFRIVILFWGPKTLEVFHWKNRKMLAISFLFSVDARMEYCELQELDIQVLKCHYLIGWVSLHEIKYYSCLSLIE